MSPKLSTLPRALALSLLVMTAAGASADTYPSKPIKLIVPYADGGMSDISARYLAGKLSAVLGQPIVIENHPGAEGAVAYAVAAKAPPDGYTLLFATTSLVTTKALRKDLSYDPLHNFAPITTLLDIQSVLIVKPELPVKSVKDVVELARQRKGQLTYASLGPGSESRLMMELFKDAAKLDIRPVSFEVASQIFTDMMANRVDMMLCLVPGALPFIKSDRLRGLAVSGPARSPALPGTPTIQEAGVSRFSQTFWSGLMAPRGTPADVIEKLQGAAHKVVNDPAVKTWALGVGAEMRGSTAVGFVTYLRQQSAVWSKLAEEPGVKAE